MSTGWVARRWALAGTMSLLVGCGSEVVQEQQPQEPVQSDGQEIVGGTNTTIANNPWQVSLQTSSGFHFCGGSVLNENWILTAQHCVNDGGVISKPARIEAGSTTISGSGQVRSVAEVIPYPGYVDPGQGKDVALLRLSTPLDLSGASVKAIGFVTAADASAGVTAPGVVARVTGWGTLSSGGSSPDTLQTVDVNLLSNSSAQTSYPNETITADQLAGAAPGKDSCQGDSGGPLTVLKGSTRVLAGVVSWGYGCADSRYPGMYARVSHFESWITSTINGTGGGGGGTCTPVALTNGVTVSNISVGASAWSCSYTLSVPAGASNLTFDLSGGTGDGDMYVKFGSEPTSTSYDCRPYKSGNTENCTIAAPSAGTYHVKIYGYSAASGMSLKGAYTTSGGGTGGTLTNGVESAQYSGAQGAWKCNTLVVPSGRTSVVFTQAGKTGTSGDADLYVRFGSAPTASSYNCRPYKSGNNESCTINSPTAGTWYACSYGYSAYTNVTMKGAY